MRLFTAAGLAGVSLVALVACHKPAATTAPASAAAPAPGPAPAASGPLTLQQMPHRKPGLWRQTMAMDTGPGAGPPPMELCVDAASEARMSIMGQRAGAHCDTPQFSRNLDGSLSFTGACDMGPRGKAQTSGTIKGDFNSSYATVIHTRMSGSPVASMNGEHTMTITATWVGPCAPGQKGGDMILPGGRKVSALGRGTTAGTPG